jgi:predicted DNA-binding transcriptional regulator AlpA
MVVNLPDTGFIRQSQLVGNKGKGIAGVVPFSPATLWRKVSSGEFPKPIKLSVGVTAWKVEDVRAWIAKHSGN